MTVDEIAPGIHRIESDLGEGTTAVMTVPNLRGEIPQPELAESV